MKVEIDRAQAYKLFDAALALPLSAREQFLAQQCEGSSDLRREVESLLAIATSAQVVTTGLRDRLGLAGSPETPVRNGLQPGERVGPYELSRPIGEGGMAEVWLARRADGAFKREVALKLPMLARLRKDLPRRFAVERDVLASLEHPHIARLYDAGVSPDGLPYLAMEYVRGELLGIWCDKRRVAARARIELFLQLLDAVRYAHERQIIHRDIKPSNILVTEDGEVRLLDFGIAKLLGADDAAGDAPLTLAFGRPLTPEYSSPEAIGGRPVDAASDVYSLGVVLYELLTGCRPYRAKLGFSVTSVEQSVSSMPVDPPSARVAPSTARARDATPQSLARMLRGDLDAIVLKALEKEPADRYSSAAALAADLCRYLAGEPVEARLNGAAYRAARWLVRRRRRGMLLAGVVAAVVAAVLLVPRLTDRGAHLETSIGSPDRSLAVLPFVDLSEKHDQQYLADGLSEELIDHLAHAKDLTVVARTSSFQFRGGAGDVRVIAAKLGVTNILEGSVRKDGEALRVTVQLIRAKDGAHLWSQSYDRNEKELFALQDDIAVAVSRELHAAWTTGRSQSRMSQPGAAAHNLVLQAMFLQDAHSRQSTQRSVELYKSALQLEAGYAMAWARLAQAYGTQALMGWRPPAEAMADAMHALDQALHFDPSLVRAHQALAMKYMLMDWDWNAAKREVDTMRGSDPDNLTEYDKTLSVYMSVIGRPDEAVRLSRQSLERDPLDVLVLNNLGFYELLARRYPDSERTLRRLLEMSPKFAQAQDLLGLSLLYQGRKQQALKEIESETDESARLAGLAIIHWALGHRADSDAALARLSSKFGERQFYSIAAAYAFRGKTDAAFDWLERAYDHHDGQMAWIKTDPLIDTLRQDPRYVALLAKMKLGADAGK